MLKDSLNYDIEKNDVILSLLNKLIGNEDFIYYLQDNLSREREFYENSPASEYQRGRVAVLKELIKVFS